ncbi:adaptor protein MecA [Macrococcoides caseolyticum]|uniref:Adapter protein MecA n=2 Tax=Macrococcoides caseolyticum TaxID=69966 RepID=MECA_MACCJ|nr:adaptor protein MecA [Macrococcus caseolyticus]B9EAQ8.1 RecName: Full=Adapter protein MecA [Macrococcus caseolyticus JCSC5402]MDJ1088821.1 adaptor protein MecA [Macrococcus caseolyticus]MDJ1109089.1 adaptor protein MecA [Macrococcus caseolyticus]MDJ1152932.1 adaptor protein MecA [Macrococcus caseolyticus]MDJ1155709.1 adaptor protein MecA [Macrococcus caseolyticus]PKE07814.1 adaptor protein MecA [Macrococcus caseolyticus]
MRIERVNESTLKFYLTYTDIEARGFKRDDLWTSRKKGEEFFWSVMEEVNQEEDFFFDGPLWIQVHAFDKGIEVVVTKSKNDDLQLPEDDSDLNIDEKVNDFINNSMHSDSELRDLLMRASEESTEQFFIVHFDDLEDVIQFSYHNYEDVDIEDLLYMYEGKYYYYVEFDDHMSEDAIHSYIAHLLEYANETQISHEQLDEYGKIVMSHNVKRQVKQYFKQ